MGKWIMQPVKIALYTDSTNTETRDVQIFPAWVCGEFAVHNRAYSENIYQADVWTVTHLPSGRVVLEANTRELAQAATTCILALDWSDVSEDNGWRTAKRAEVRKALAGLPQEDVWLPPRPRA